MNKHLYISFLLLLIVTFSGAQTFKIYGYIIDEQTNTPIKNVNIKVNGTQKGCTSDLTGYYSIELSAVCTLIISHVQYESKEIIITKTVSRKTDISLTEKIYTIGMVDISQNKPVNLVAKKLYDVTDYEFCGDLIMLFAYCYKEKVNPWLILMSEDGDTVCRQHIPVEGSLYKDCLGNVHLISRDSAYQIYYDSTEIHLLYPVSPKEFQEAMSPCIAEMNNRFYLKQYYYNNQVLSYFVANPEDSSLHEFRVIADDIGLNMLANRNRFHSMGGVAPTEADLRFEQMCFFDPIFAPLVKIKDRICIFNYVDSLIEFYNEKGEAEREIPICFHNEKYWKEEIYVDEKAGTAYTLFKKNGISTLRKIDLETGILTTKIPIPNFLFIEKVRVFNDSVYFLYRNNSDNDLMKLFRLRI
ncbi:MAG: carboxypeptidase-like regulatory domain-containing protein [Bacteroidota bacterium]